MITYYPQQYYNITAQAGNIEDTETPLLVNCCGIATIPPGNERRMSTVTRNDYYLMYMISGELQAELGGKAFLLKNGSFVCIPPRTPYLYNCVSSESVKYFWIHFTGMNARYTLEGTGIAPLMHYMASDISASAELYEKLFSVFRNRSENFVYRAALLLQNILMSLAGSAESGTVAKNALDESIKYIHTHLKEDISIRALAEMEYMSDGYYRALFNKLTGMSPREYVATQRINRACQLLSETTQSIDSIAESVGIKDRLYFQRFFKKHMGITPSRYREAQKK